MLALSEKTVRNHRIYLEAYPGWWRSGHGLEPATAARPGDVAAFLIDEAGRGLASRTRKSELRALRGLGYTHLAIDDLRAAVTAVRGPA